MYRRMILSFAAILAGGCVSTDCSSYGEETHEFANCFLTEKEKEGGPIPCNILKDSFENETSIISCPAQTTPLNRCLSALCIDDVAKNTANAELCTTIPEQYGFTENGFHSYTDSCLLNISVTTNNTAICSSIREKFLSDICLGGII